MCCRCGQGPPDGARRRHRLLARGSQAEGRNASGTEHLAAHRKGRGRRRLLNLTLVLTLKLVNSIANRTDPIPSFETRTRGNEHRRMLTSVEPRGRLLQPHTHHRPRICAPTDGAVHSTARPERSRPRLTVHANSVAYCKLAAAIVARAPGNSPTLRTASSGTREKRGPRDGLGE